MNQYKTSVKIIIIIKMNSVDSKKTALAKIDKNIFFLVCDSYEVSNKEGDVWY